MDWLNRRIGRGCRNRDLWPPKCQTINICRQCHESTEFASRYPAPSIDILTVWQSTPRHFYQYGGSEVRLNGSPATTWCPGNPLMHLTHVEITNWSLQTGKVFPSRHTVRCWRHCPETAFWQTNGHEINEVISHWIIRDFFGQGFSKTLTGGRLQGSAQWQHHAL